MGRPSSLTGCADDVDSTAFRPGEQLVTPPEVSRSDATPLKRYAWEGVVVAAVFKYGTASRAREPRAVDQTLKLPLHRLTRSPPRTEAIT
jgi:hypothetical protein